MEGTKRVTRNTLVRRSKLFVPVNREKFVAKAWTREADCIILDLEDAVAPADKASARKMVKDVILIVGMMLGGWGAEVIHVEPPGQGDNQRHLLAQGMSGWAEPHEINYLWEHVDRNKKSIAINLGSTEGQQVLHKLIASAVHENMACVKPCLHLQKVKKSEI